MVGAGDGGRRAVEGEEEGVAGDDAPPTLASRRRAEEPERRVQAQEDELQEGVGEGVAAHGRLLALHENLLRIGSTTPTIS